MWTGIAACSLVFAVMLLPADAAQCHPCPFGTCLGAWHRDMPGGSSANVLLRDPTLRPGSGHRSEIDAQFLGNGHLLVFDNRGSPESSRVLEYDPQTLAFPWSYSGENRGGFRSTERGMNQRLANGNTLVVNSCGGELLEVTADKEVVWSFAIDGYIATARRYAPQELHFLKGETLARP